MGLQKGLSRRFFVSGRVQGVGYRWFVQQAASGMGLRGYTRNLSDGRVEVFAMGTPAQIEELGGFLWKGPSASEVQNVDEQEAGPEDVTGFRITR